MSQNNRNERSFKDRSMSIIEGNGTRNHNSNKGSETISTGKFNQWIKDEYEKSNISQELFEHATEIYYPDEVDQDTQLPLVFGRLFGDSFMLKNGKPSQRVKKYFSKYDFLRHGAWVAKVSDLNGKLSDYTQIKPIKPRFTLDHKGKKKPVKYESLPEYQTKDYHCVAYITDRNILDNCIENLCDNYGINSQEVDNSKINSYLELIIYFGKKHGIIPRITEGFKKHLADIEEGHLSISSN